ncbi:MAG TPA: acylglycerol kinase family protein, partial [Actinomycetes bacterium]|nr:acylglycerol kinase family protein [Actinomycetes bacterium]
MPLLIWVTAAVLLLAAAVSGLAWRRPQDAAYVGGVAVAASGTTALAGLPAGIALALAGYGSLVALVLRRSRRAIPRTATVLAAVALTTAAVLQPLLDDRSGPSVGAVITAGLIGAGWLVIGTYVWLRYRPVRAHPAPVAVPSRPVGVVLNPAKYTDGGAAVRAEILDQAAALGYDEPVFRETAALDAGLGQARELIELGTGLVIACGGDGTVRACADALAGTWIPLGIVPVGTGNLLAR